MKVVIRGLAPVLTQSSPDPGGGYHNLTNRIQKPTIGA
jgi:hypothetical protein